MMTPEIQIAKLDEKGLGKLQALEKELGTAIVALEPQIPFATLSPEQAQKLETLENELGVVLLAYRPKLGSRSSG